MPINKIEIICKPCRKCDLLKERIDTILKAMEFKYHVKFRFELVHTTNLSAMSKYSLNPTQVPVVVINGHVEFAGFVKDPHLIRMKLEAINAGL